MSTGARPDASSPVPPMEPPPVPISAARAPRPGPPWVPRPLNGDRLQSLMYTEHGAREYLIWRTEDQAIDWYRLIDGKYQPIARDAEGILRSTFFPGLWLDAAALIDFETHRVRGLIRRGLASPEHAAFVARLRERAAGQGGGGGAPGGGRP